jgi:hypothetical protein
MIHEIVAMLRRSGVDLPDQVVREVSAEFHHLHGGERTYIPKLPKLAGQMRLQALGTATATMTQVQISQATGLQVRQIRRLTNGR